MKPFIISIIISLTVLTGCYVEPPPPSESPVVFTITERDKIKLSAIIRETLDGYYWKYDFNSLFFEEEALTFDSRTSPKYLSMERAAASIGLDFSKRSGGASIVAAINLLHNSNEPAGQARFYFSGGTLVCAYYTVPGAENVYYGLREKNIYIIDDPFAAYEDYSVPYPEPVVVNKYDFQKFSITENNKTRDNILASAADDKLFFYEYNDGGAIFTLKREVSFNGLIPMDFAFLPGGGCAVLLGDRNEDWDGAKDYSSKQLIVLNDEYSILYGVNLGNDYTAVAAYDNSLLLCRGKILEFYTVRRDSIAKRSQAMISHWANAVECTDLANGGQIDIAATDGTDLYLYRLKDSDIPDLIWRTYSGTAFAYSRISVRDLNGDGVSEIYLTDPSLSFARYTLDINGLRADSAGEDAPAGIYIVGILTGGGYKMMVYEDGE